MKAAPIRVTASERQIFIANYETQRKRLMNLLIGGVLLAVLALAFILSGPDEQFLQGSILAVTGIFMVLFMLAHRRIWNAPARSLRGRPAVGAPPSKAEVRKAYTATFTYRQMAVICLMGILLAVQQYLSHRDDPDADHSMLYMAALVIAIYGLLAFRKWRAERAKGSSSPLS